MGEKCKNTIQEQECMDTAKNQNGTHGKLEKPEENLVYPNLQRMEKDKLLCLFMTKWGNLPWQTVHTALDLG